MFIHLDLCNMHMLGKTFLPLNYKNDQSFVFFFFSCERINVKKPSKLALYKCTLDCSHASMDSFVSNELLSKILLNLLFFSSKFYLKGKEIQYLHSYLIIVIYSFDIEHR